MRVGAVLVVVVAAAWLAVAGDASAFTIKDVTMRSDGKRLTYSLVICTSSKASLRLKGTFAPKPSGHGARTARPGARQYQDTGCYPSAVSVPVATVVGRCPAASCAARRGRRYAGRVAITDTATHKTRLAPRLTARA